MCESVLERRAGVREFWVDGCWMRILHTPRCRTFSGPSTLRHTLRLDSVTLTSVRGMAPVSPVAACAAAPPRDSHGPCCVLVRVVCWSVIGTKCRTRAASCSAWLRRC